MVTINAAVAELPGIEAVGSLSPTTLGDLCRWAEASIQEHADSEGRKTEIWYGKKLSGKPLEVSEGICDARLNAFGNRLLDGWDSAILCRYASQVGAPVQGSLHCFTSDAIIVTCSNLTLLTVEGRFKKRFKVGAGTILRVESRVPIGVEPEAVSRCLLTFQRLKAEYLTLPLLAL